jgi:hypothetical protein
LFSFSLPFNLAAFSLARRSDLLSRPLSGVRSRILALGAIDLSAGAAFWLRINSMSGVVFGFSMGSFDGRGIERGSFAGIGAGALGSRGGGGAAPSAPSAVAETAAGASNARKAWKSGSDSIVPALESMRCVFLGTFWKGENSICGIDEFPLLSVNMPCAFMALARAAM